MLAEFPTAAWAAAEGARLEALRLDAVERRADALMANGAARDTVADLRAHVSGHPGREDGWVLLATAPGGPVSPVGCVCRWEDTG